MWKDFGRGAVCFHQEWCYMWNQHAQPVSNAGCSRGRMEGREDARGKVGSVLETLEVMPRVELILDAVGCFQEGGGVMRLLWGCGEKQGA